MTPDAPHYGPRYLPPVQTPASPVARDTLESTHPEGPVPGPHTHTSAPTAGGQRAPTARPKDGRPVEDERLAPDTPHEGAGHPSHARTIRAPKHGQRTPAPPKPPFRRTGGRRGVPTRDTLLPPLRSAPPRGTRKLCCKPKHASETSRSPHPRRRAHSTWATNPCYPPPGRAAKRGRAPDCSRPSQRPRGNLTPPLRHATPSRARAPKARSPASAHPRPQSVVGGLRPPARRTSSRKGLGASARTPHAEVSGAQLDVSAEGSLQRRTRASHGWTTDHGRRPSGPAARGGRARPEHVHGAPTRLGGRPLATPATHDARPREYRLRDRFQSLTPRAPTPTDHHRHRKAIEDPYLIPALRHSDTTTAEPAASRNTRPRCPKLDEPHEVIKVLGLQSRGRDPPKEDTESDSDLEVIPTAPARGAPAGPTTPVVSRQTLCPAWKRGHCTGEGWCPRQRPALHCGAGLDPR